MYPTKHGGGDDFNALGEGKSSDDHANSNYPGELAEFPRIDPHSNATTRDTGQSQSNFPRPRQPQYYQYTQNPPNPNNPDFHSNSNNMQLQTPGNFTRPEQSTMDPSSLSRQEGGHHARMEATPFSGYGTRARGDFDTVGRTPLTAASLGTSQEPIIAEMNPQLPAGTGDNTGNVATPMGLSAAGLVRGDDPLQPTPVVRRKETERLRQQHQQNPDRAHGIHYHAPVELSSLKKDPSPQRLTRDSSAFQQQEEEDPSILRYESRPGADQSPLVARGTVLPAAGSAERPNLSAMDDPSHSSSSNRPPGQSAMDASTEESQHQQHEQPPPMSTSLREFPFYFDGYGAWVCRHCTHVPPYYRGVNYVWQFPHAPPNHFVDQHLAFCQGLNPPSAQPPPPPPPEASSGYPMQFPNMAQTPLPPPLQGGYIHPMHHQHPPYLGQPEHHQHQRNTPQSQLVTRQESRQSSQSSAEPQSLPDPPGVTTPKSSGTGSESMVSLGQGQRPKSSAQPGEPHFFTRHPYQQAPQYPYPSYHPPPPLQQSTSMMPPPGPPTILHSPRSNLSRPPRPGSATSASPALKKKSGVKTSPSGRSTDDKTYTKSIQFLKQKSDARPEPTDSDIGATLIDDSDSDLLTDYFFYMMKQLVVCRFSEKDRKTRGGKRESINLGYGGLQCLHCFENPGSRKFYWSNVDRLANSFAEIPGHVLKCKSCPDDIKDALLVLKGRHSDQMQLLPRGSQKVFFRRMWRRLHDGDAEAGVAATAEGAASTSSKESSSTTNRGITSSGESEPSFKSSIIDSETAARILKESKSETPITSSKLQPERILLAIPEDKEWLSDMDCFVRQNIEVFSATTRDVAVAEADRKYPIKPGQVGIRCIHCALTAEGARGTAVSYPYSISGIYESVREFQRMHLENCTNLPPDRRAHSQKLGGATSLSSVLRRYYVQSARALGLFDTAQGIKAGADPVPMSSAGFQSPTSTFRNLSLPSPQISDLAQRKRKAPEDEDDSKPEAKRQDNMDSKDYTTE
ncbi:hypothetical protein ACHAXS_013313 [Conticribra weissflogii]